MGAKACCLSRMAGHRSVPADCHVCCALSKQSPSRPTFEYGFSVLSELRWRKYS